MINIEPVRVYPDTATAVEFGTITLEPFIKACAEWRLHGADGSRLASGMVETTPAQYAAWGTDDSYINDCFLVNLGLTKV